MNNMETQTISSRTSGNAPRQRSGPILLQFPQFRLTTRRVYQVYLTLGKYGGEFGFTVSQDSLDLIVESVAGHVWFSQNPNHPNNPRMFEALGRKRENLVAGRFEACIVLFANDLVIPKDVSHHDREELDTALEEILRIRLWLFNNQRIDNDDHMTGDSWTVPEAWKTLQRAKELANSLRDSPDLEHYDWPDVDATLRAEDSHLRYRDADKVDPDAPWYMKYYQRIAEAIEDGDEEQQDIFNILVLEGLSFPKPYGNFMVRSDVRSVLSEIYIALEKKSLSPTRYKMTEVSDADPERLERQRQAALEGGYAFP